MWFRTHVRDPLRDDPAVILATIIFRWFNYIPTAEVLMGGASNLLLDWSEPEALARLGAIRDAGGQVFTGAYMVNSPGGKPKLEEICRRITAVWKRGDFLRRRSRDWPRMQLAHEDLLRFEGSQRAFHVVEAFARGDATETDLAAGVPPGEEGWDAAEAEAQAAQGDPATRPARAVAWAAVAVFFALGGRSGRSSVSNWTAGTAGQVVSAVL